MTHKSFVKNGQGLYEINGSVQPDDIAKLATEILSEKLSQQDVLTAPTDVARFLQLKLGAEEFENFSVIFLDTRHRVITYQKLFTGTIDSAAVYPRVIIKSALTFNAAAVILAHNHPSNEATRYSRKPSLTHLVEQMAYVGQKPWHGLGNALTAERNPRLMSAPVDRWPLTVGAQSPRFISKLPSRCLCAQPVRHCLDWRRGRPVGVHGQVIGVAVDRGPEWLHESRPYASRRTADMSTLINRPTGDAQTAHAGLFTPLRVGRGLSLSNRLAVRR